MSKKSMGAITLYDFVTMDEIQTITFSDSAEIQAALKSYLEFGYTTVANVKLISQAGLIIMGNISLSSDKKPIRSKYFTELPETFKESALLDRFHGFIEGWKLPRISEDLKINGWTLNVEYFSEILHELREKSVYSTIVNDLIDIPAKADTRDTTAVKRLATAYLKMLFPQVSNKEDITKDEFFTYCLKPALEKRQIIRSQIHMIDEEFSDEMPDIKLKN
jgi:ATP-dependent Lon protease